MQNEKTENKPRAERRRTRRPRRSRRVSRLLGRGSAGMTIIEIMVVVIIMGLIMSAAGIAIFNQLKRARVRTTQQAITQVQAAIRLYQNDHPDSCPTVEQMQASGDLDRSRSSNDAWGHAFRIECNNGEIAVRSDGPDGRQGTDDDLPAPSTPGGAGGGGPN